MGTYAIIELTDFKSSIGGEHTYAQIKLYVEGSNMGDSEVLRILSAEDARKLNEKDDSDHHVEGAESSRFDTEEEAITKALENIVLKWAFCTFVFSQGVSNPARCFLADTDMNKDAFNALHAKWESFYKDTNDPWANGDGVRIDKVYKQWEQLLKITGVE